VIVIRPSPSNRVNGAALWLILRSPFAVFGLLIVLLLSVRSIISGSGVFIWAVGFGAILFLGIGAYYALYLAKVSLYVRTGKLGATDFLGRRHEIPLEDASALHLCSVAYNNGANVQPYLLAITKSSRCAFAIASADHFSVNEIGRIASAASIPISGSWHELIPLNELDRRFPGALSAFWRFVVGDWRHPKLVSATVVSVLVALILLVVVFTVLKSQGMM
jgi:hypothetical protein